jgi:hypothetical protein
MPPEQTDAATPLPQETLQVFAPVQSTLHDPAQTTMHEPDCAQLICPPFPVLTVHDALAEQS